MKIELGGGAGPQSDADIVIDPKYPKGTVGSLAQETPWVRQDTEWMRSRDYRKVIPDGTVDEVVAFHVLEHIPAGWPRIAVFNEAHRVLKSGGTFKMRFPLAGYTLDGPHLLSGSGPWADPTHLSFWWLPESLWYFTGQGTSEDYGIEKWEPLGPYVPAERVWVDPHLPSWWTVRWGIEGYACLARP